MANIQEDLRTFIRASTAITDIVGTRVHYNYAPAVSVKPLIWFRVKSDKEPLTLDNVGGMHEAMVDIECVGADPDEMLDLADVVKSRFHGYTGAVGSHSCKAAFMSDKDDEYIPKSSQADEGSHIASFTLDLWYTS